jgi:peptide/nickel transport system substrate-binding protein
MRPRILTVALAAIIGLGMAQQGTLELAVESSPAGLDPHIVTAFSSFQIIGQVYEGLMEINADLQLEPALATGFTVSSDGLTYTFTLREGVKFHNGRAFTADDVVYSFERIVDVATGSPQASRFAQVASVEAVDDLTARFTLRQAYAPFLANLPQLTIVAREAVEEHGNLQQVAIGTGPFMLSEIVPDTYTLLTANPDYYRAGEPGVAALKYNVVPEASTRAAGLRTGAYHLVPDVDPATAQTLGNVSGITLLGIQDLAYTLLGVNVTRPPFDDPLVRRALNLAIDRDEIVEAVYYGDAVPGGPLSPGLTDWALPVSEYNCYASDPVTARRLLADAGYPNGVDFEIVTLGTLRVVVDAAQVMQAQLADAGFRATVSVEELGSFVQRWRNSDFDTFASLNGGNIDPDGYLDRTFRTGGSTNVFQYSNPAVDTLLTAGQRAVDPGVRRGIYADLQRALACDGPVVHLAYATLFTAHRDEVAGFVQTPTRSLRYLRNVTLN